ncbi:LytR/AlgR family response regulator transcription factor [Flavihumibacter petaseus]|uniref:Putative two-component response regulator n=1 Tax=Flavihumibacter petaseus NBRC 106054 TaxID=1220578 RepID=A0A0E9MY39_9BACT|nr:LytTR family DNA-binding domain-containing protein [Flavihumibacter petaseus]GAO42356.1 putative two-component response regulator [Flavihumibacter petaseus NBRC 106054]
MITATIVDDEPDCCESLAVLLERYCPEVKVLDICHSGEAALQSVKEQHPQILFLDIEMPFMNGFELLEKLGNIDFELIFTTSYDQYAIKAFRFSALDYLLKPVDREELQKAVQKAVQRKMHPLPQQLEMLLQKYKHPAIPVNKIAIPTMEGFQLLAADAIISCESDNNYTCLFLKDKRKIVASRTLKEMEEILEDYPFVRVHHSHIVNLNEVEKYIKGEGGYVIMSNGATINVSRSRKELLLRTFR